MRNVHLLLVCLALLLTACKKDDVEPDGHFSQTGTFQGPDESIASIAVSPDGKLIAYGTFADTLIRVIDVSTMQEKRTLSGHTKPVTALAFSPNGQLLASTGTVNLPPGIDGTVRLWNVETGTQINSVETAPAGMSQLAFSPDGNLLAGACGGGTTLRVSLWDGSTLNPVRDIPGVFRMVAFSPDGSRIATGKRDDKVYIMETATGNGIGNFGGHTGWIQSVAYSYDGQSFATGGEDRTILIRNAQDGQTILTLTGHTSYPDYLRFNPDGSMLASLGSGTNITRTSSGGISITIGNADRFLRLWDLVNKVELARLNIGTDVISEISFSADWQVLATGSTNGLIRIFQWDGSTSVPAEQVAAAGMSIRNFPNPFISATTIEYHLQDPAEIEITIYNNLGQPVSTLVRGIRDQGLHQVIWNAEGLSPGYYFCRLIEKSSTTIHRMLKM